MADFTFQESCGLTCQTGRRPVTYGQRIENGSPTWDKQWPRVSSADLNRREILGASICAKRHPSVNSLEVQFNMYAWNGVEQDKDINAQSVTAVHDESPYAGLDVIVVTE